MATREPHWQGRKVPRKIAAEAKEAPKPRDFVAEAKAVINAADQRSDIIAAVIVAQALDRFGKQVETSAAVANYKRVT